MRVDCIVYIDSINFGHCPSSGRYHNYAKEADEPIPEKTFKIKNDFKSHRDKRI